MKNIKLLQAANSECTNKAFIIRMCECVKDRLLELQMRTTFRPTSVNEETLCEWEEIADVANDILKKYKEDEIDDELKNIGLSYELPGNKQIGNIKRGDKDDR